MQLKSKCKIKGPHTAKVLNNIKLSGDTGKIIFRNKIIAENSAPGQFVSILCEDLLLRRPFSVANSKDDTFEIIYKIKGKGTQFLAGLKNGDSANIIGPLGKGFSPENKNSLLIGCGVGIAPIIFLSDILAKSGINHTSLVCTQTYLCHSEGFSPKNLSNHEGKQPNRFPPSFLIFNQKIGVPASLRMTNSNSSNDNKIIITEDGSAGLKGRLDNHLENIIKEVKPEKIYTCGPTAAMAYICKTAEKYNITTEVALERDFACGTGVCMGCVIQIKENDKLINKRICKDGPVFLGSEVVW